MRAASHAAPPPADSAAEQDDAAKLQPFTVLELSKLMRLDEKTVYQHANQGRIPGVLRVGRRMMFAKPAIVAWLSGAELPRAAKGGRR